MERWSEPDELGPENEGAEAEPTSAGGPSWIDSLQDQFGSAPWWATSAVVHVVLVLLTMLLVISSQSKPPDDKIIPMDITRDPPPVIRSEHHTLTPSAVQVDMPIVVEHPFVAHETYEDLTHRETENELDNNTARGDESAISDVPCGGQGLCANAGIGGLSGGCFGTRNGGGRKRAALRNGGSLASEGVVDAALEWLAKHQESDGSWSVRKHEGAFTESGNVAVTGLALLAFLGAGHTDAVGRYKENVGRAINFLVGKQQANGALGENNGPESGWSVGGGYNHMIAGLALAEAYGMNPKSSRTQSAAQKAVDYACNIHQTQGSGWRYKPGIAADLSVSGWGAMMLKSAKIAGLRVPEGSFQGAMNFVNSVSNKAGGDYGGGIAAYQPGESPTPMTASMGMVCRIFLGEPKGSPSLSASADMLQKNLPAWGKDVGDTGGCQFYYWYYGTMGMFQIGGSYWDAWNPPMRDMLVQHQRRGGDADGSWDPVGARDGRRGGRAYATAMGALCLEVYYRYLPVYGAGGH